MQKRTMPSLTTPYLHSGDELNTEEISALIQHAILLKQQRLQKNLFDVCKNKHLAMLFDKPSLRTRFSFTVAMSELGGTTIESLAQTRKQENPEDLIRVLQGYCHAILIRTFDDSFIEKLIKAANIPVINGLSDLFHPCQILADIMTLQEHFSYLKNLIVSYIGDGNNILHSMLLMMPKLGIHVQYCCPSTRNPHPEIVQKAIAQHPGLIHPCDTPKQAVLNANAVYTDVWNSMGFEERDLSMFENFQVNETLMTHANAHAIFMHCMPMQRGQEVSETLPDQPCSKIFQQSENRLHVQKALLIALLKE